MILAVLLTLLQERPYQARVTIEESAPSGDWTARTTGTAIVSPGESVHATLAGRRMVFRPSSNSARSEVQPLSLWTLSSSDLAERFEMIPEAVVEERALSEVSGRDAPVRARRASRSLAIAVERPSDGAAFRLVPRGEGGKAPTVRIWREIPSSRLARVEVVTPMRRTICVVEVVRELEDPESGK